MVSINLNFKKQHFYLLAAVLVFLVGVGFVISYGGSAPATMGHSFGELEGVQKTITGSCAGQVMVGVDANGAVICEDDDAGSGGGGVVKWGNIGTWMINPSYSGNEVCANIGKTCIGTYYMRLYDYEATSTEYVYAYGSTGCSTNIGRALWTQNGISTLAPPLTLQGKIVALCK